MNPHVLCYGLGLTVTIKVRDIDLWMYYGYLIGVMVEV